MMGKDKLITAVNRLAKAIEDFPGAWHQMVHGTSDEGVGGSLGLHSRYSSVPGPSTSQEPRE